MGHLAGSRVDTVRNGVKSSKRSHIKSPFKIYHVLSVTGVVAAVIDVVAAVDGQKRGHLQERIQAQLDSAPRRLEQVVYL